MDKTRFKSEKMPGRLLEITVADGVHDWSFIPNPLADLKWNLDVSLWPLVAEARDAVGRLAGIGEHLPNPDLLLAPLQRSEAISSSSIEGAYATMEQLLLYEMEPRDPKSEKDVANDWREVWNYRNALRDGWESIVSGKNPISNRLLTMMHQRLLDGVRGKETSLGDWRRSQVCIGYDRRFIPPPVSELPALLGDLQKAIGAQPPNGIDPLVWAYVCHYQFETIHPFSDGNGRVGRALLSIMVSDHLDHNMPWLYMSEFFEKYKREYIESLYNISAEGAWNEWVKFCLVGTIQQATKTTRTSKKLVALREEFKEKGQKLSRRTSAIIESLFEYPIVTVPAIKKKYSCAYHTAQRDIDKLVKVEILTELDGKHPKRYFSPRVFKLAYHDHKEDEVIDEEKAPEEKTSSEKNAQ